MRGAVGGGQEQPPAVGFGEERDGEQQEAETQPSRFFSGYRTRYQPFFSSYTAISAPFFSFATTLASVSGVSRIFRPSIRVTALAVMVSPTDVDRTPVPSTET